MQLLCVIGFLFRELRRWLLPRDCHVYAEGDILTNSQAIHEFSTDSGGLIDSLYAAGKCQFNRL